MTKLFPFSFFKGFLIKDQLSFISGQSPVSIDQISLFLEIIFHEVVKPAHGSLIDLT
jgi:hypothetical protein